MSDPNYHLPLGNLAARIPLETREAPVFDWRELVVVGAICALLLLGMAILMEVREVREDLDLQHQARLRAVALAGWDRAEGRGP